MAKINIKKIVKEEIDSVIKEDTNFGMANLLYRLHVRLGDAIKKGDTKEAKRVSDLFNAVEKKLEKKGFDVEKFMLSKGVLKHYNDEELFDGVIKEDTYLGMAGPITVEKAPAGFIILSTQSGARIAMDKQTCKEFIKILKKANWFVESTNNNVNQLTEEDKYWAGDVGPEDDFQKPIKDEFIDGATQMGPWAIMSPESFRRYGVGLGQGRGQQYKKQPDGRWKKIKG